jgi:hypothetical protein
MLRREFIAGLAGAATLSVAARAQQVIPVIGFLHGADRNEVGQSAGNYAARVLKGERHLICRLYSRRASSSSSI